MMRSRIMDLASCRMHPPSTCGPSRGMQSAACEPSLCRWSLMIDFSAIFYFDIFPYPTLYLYRPLGHINCGGLANQRAPFSYH